ncbi:WD40 repeat domain-containing protein, partial [Micromonospora sp. CP22]|uniref:NACHT and WD repeat domain-containing protein n=1 Tax=Micromonospora sp. CP22 TaxID=2580517 RepID=UPI0018AD10D3
MAAGRDITGTVNTGPTYVQVTAGRFDQVHNAVFDPAPLFELLDLARFQGRKELISRIDERITTTDRGYVVVRGEAGVGKSALAAHLVWTRPCAYHFTGLDGGARNPVEARKSLAAQLIGAWRLAQRFTPGDVFPAAAERPDWLAKVIRAAIAARNEQYPPAERRPIVLVVDGLDEAEPDPPGMGTGIPLGLPTPDALPAGAYIIATSRYGIPLVALRDPLRVGWSQIDVQGADNLVDMAAYLQSATNGPGSDPALTRALRDHGVTAETFTTTLLNRCQGVWIYLRYVLDEIRAGLRPPNDVACLPDRLRGYYEQHVQRWSEHPAWEPLHLPALAVLAALRRRVTIEELASALQQPGVAGELTKWLDGPARAFLDVTTSMGYVRHYQVRHQSLRDLFNAPATTYDDREPLDAGLSERLHAAWTTAHRAIANWLIPLRSSTTGRRDWASVDHYTRLQLASHAAAGKVLDDLVLDPGFLLSFPPGQILWHRHTLTHRQHITAAAALESAANSEWSNRTESERAWWLQVWARKTGSTHLADTLTCDHPDWPWHVHSAVWSGTTARILTGHTGAVVTVAALPGPDGQYRIVSGSSDRTIRIWDPDSGSLLAELTGHGEGLSAVAVLPGLDGQYRIVSGSSDGTVRVWDADTGTQLAVFSAHTDEVSSVVVLPSPDGRHRIVSTGDETIRVWDADNAIELTRLTGHTSEVTALAVLPGPDGRHRIVSTGDETVRVWDPDNGIPLAVLTGHTSWVSSVAVLPSPDGRHRIVSTGDGTVRVWDPDTGTQLSVLGGHTEGLSAVTVLPAPNGRHRIVSTGDETVRVWDPDDGTQIAELTGHADEVIALAVLPGPEGQYRIISGSSDRTVRVWDPDNATELTELTGHTNEVTALAVLPGPEGQYRIISGSS